jgi:hypothetical protein
VSEHAAEQKTRQAWEQARAASQEASEALEQARAAEQIIRQVPEHAAGRKARPALERIADQKTRQEWKSARAAIRKAREALEQARAAEQYTRQVWERACAAEEEVRSAPEMASVTVCVVNAPHAGIRRIRINKLPCTIRRLDLKRPKGVMISDGGRQENVFNYTLREPRVRLDRLRAQLEERPELRRALTRLAHDPRSRAANRIFKRCLERYTRPNRPSRGHADLVRGEPLTFEARLDTRNALSISGARGVVVGKSAAVRNNFHYRLSRPEIAVEELVAGDPAMARTLVRVLEEPGDMRARNLLGRKLKNAMRSGDPVDLLDGIQSSPKTNPAVVRTGDGWADVEGGIPSVGSNNRIDVHTGVKIDRPDIKW